MFDTFRGLPVHALVVHAVVVLVPLAALGLILVAVRPSWRRSFGPVVVLLATAGLAMVPVATRSGHRLKERLDASGIVAKQIKNHQDMGSLVIWPTLAMWVLSIALIALDRRRGGSTGLTTAIAGLAVLAALASVAQVAVTGELGTKAVWACTIQSSACK
jgi:hypothetical protein